MAIVGAWLNKLVINSAKDASPNGLDGTINGNPTMQKVGIKLDGTGDFISNIGTFSTFNAFHETGIFTIAGWARLGAVDDGLAHVIFGTGTGGEGGRSFLLFYEDRSGLGQNELRVLITNALPGTTIDLHTADETFADMDWHYVVVTGDGITCRIYIDGSESSNGAFGAFGSGNAQDIAALGITPDAEVSPWNGELQDWRIHLAETKSPSWVKREFLAGVPDPSLVLQVMGDGKDRSRYGRVLSQFGTPGVGRRIKLNGSTDYLREAVSDWRIGDTKGTICGWIKANTVGTSYVLFSSADEAAGNRYVILQLRADNKLAFIQKSGVDDNLYGDTILTANRWYHVAVTSDGSTYKLYVNGLVQSLSIATGTNSGDWFAETTTRDNLVLGAMVTASLIQPFDGDMDDWHVYSEDKSAEWLREYVLQTRNFF